LELQGDIANHQFNLTCGFAKGMPPHLGQNDTSTITKNTPQPAKFRQGWIFLRKLLFEKLISLKKPDFFR
jgi:hypothetical protein